MTEPFHNPLVVKIQLISLVTKGNIYLDCMLIADKVSL